MDARKDATTQDKSLGKHKLIDEDIDMTACKVGVVINAKLLCWFQRPRNQQPCAAAESSCAHVIRNSRQCGNFKWTLQVDLHHTPTCRNEEAIEKLDHRLTPPKNLCIILLNQGGTNYKWALLE